VSGPVLPDGYLNPYGLVYEAVAAQLGVPAEQLGHLIILVQPVNGQQQAAVITCCDDTTALLPEILRVAADDIERRATYRMS
jgi:hypothetical protein